MQPRVSEAARLFLVASFLVLVAQGPTFSGRGSQTALTVVGGGVCTTCTNDNKQSDKTVTTDANGNTTVTETGECTKEKKAQMTPEELAKKCPDSKKGTTTYVNPDGSKYQIGNTGGEGIVSQGSGGTASPSAAQPYADNRPAISQVPLTPPDAYTSKAIEDAFPGVSEGAAKLAYPINPPASTGNGINDIVNGPASSIPGTELDYSRPPSVSLNDNIRSSAVSLDASGGATPLMQSARSYLPVSSGASGFGGQEGFAYDFSNTKAAQYAGNYGENGSPMFDFSNTGAAQYAGAYSPDDVFGSGGATALAADTSRPGLNVYYGPDEAYVETLNPDTQLTTNDGKTVTAGYLVDNGISDVRLSDLKNNFNLADDTAVSRQTFDGSGKLLSANSYENLDSMFSNLESSSKNLPDSADARVTPIAQTSSVSDSSDASAMSEQPIPVSVISVKDFEALQAAARTENGSAVQASSPAPTATQLAFAPSAEAAALLNARGIGAPSQAIAPVSGSASANVDFASPQEIAAAVPTETVSARSPDETVTASAPIETVPASQGRDTTPTRQPTAVASNQPSATVRPSPSPSRATSGSAPAAGADSSSSGSIPDLASLLPPASAGSSVPSPVSSAPPVSQAPQFMPVLTTEMPSSFQVPLPSLGCDTALCPPAIAAVAFTPTMRALDTLAGIAAGDAGTPAKPSEATAPPAQPERKVVAELTGTASCYDPTNTTSCGGTNYEGGLKTATGKYVGDKQPTVALSRQLAEDRGCGIKGKKCEALVTVTSGPNAGKSVVATIDDNGPLFKGRVADLSSKTAELLGMDKSGVLPVKIEIYAKEAKPAVADAKTATPASAPKAAESKQNCNLLSGRAKFTCLYGSPMGLGGPTPSDTIASETISGSSGTDAIRGGAGNDNLGGVQSEVETALTTLKQAAADGQAAKDAFDRKGGLAAAKLGASGAHALADAARKVAQDPDVSKARKQALEDSAAKMEQIAEKIVVQVPKIGLFSDAGVSDLKDDMQKAVVETLTHIKGASDAIAKKGTASAPPVAKAAPSTNTGTATPAQRPSPADASKTPAGATSKTPAATGSASTVRFTTSGVASCYDPTNTTSCGGTLFEGGMKIAGRGGSYRANIPAAALRVDLAAQTNCGIKGQDCTARVTDTKTGKSITVTINDNGPLVKGRVIDLNPMAKAALGGGDLPTVKVEIISGDGTAVAENAPPSRASFRIQIPAKVGAIIPVAQALARSVSLCIGSSDCGSSGSTQVTDKAYINSLCQPDRGCAAKSLGTQPDPKFSESTMTDQAERTREYAREVAAAGAASKGNQPVLVDNCQYSGACAEILKAISDWNAAHPDKTLVPMINNPLLVAEKLGKMAAQALGKMASDMKGGIVIEPGAGTIEQNDAFRKAIGNAMLPILAVGTGPQMQALAQEITSKALQNIGTSISSATEGAEGYRDAVAGLPVTIGIPSTVERALSQFAQGLAESGPPAGDPQEIARQLTAQATDVVHRAFQTDFLNSSDKLAGIRGDGSLEVRPEGVVYRVDRAGQETQVGSIRHVSGAAPSLPAPTRITGTNIAGINPVIARSMEEASRLLPAGYTAKVISASRNPGESHVGSRSLHIQRDAQGKSLAVDVQITDPNGAVLKNIRAPQNFGIYRDFMQNVKAYQDKMFPQLASRGRWGGYFVSGDSQDLMHYDLGPKDVTAAGNWEQGLNRMYAYYGMPGDVGVGMGSISTYKIPDPASIVPAEFDEFTSTDGSVRVALPTSVDEGVVKVTPQKDENGDTTYQLEYTPPAPPPAPPADSPIARAMAAARSAMASAQQQMQNMFKQLQNMFGGGGGGSKGGGSGGGSGSKPGGTGEQPQPIPLPPPTQPAGAMRLSCTPDTVVNGSPATPLTISWQCPTGTRSTGTGFSTLGAQTGSATLTVSTSSAIILYKLECAGTKTESTTCSVKVKHPRVVLVAKPTDITAGKSAEFEWSSTDVDSCRLYAPPAVLVAAGGGTGRATSLPFSRSAEFKIVCATGAATTSASATVHVEGDSQPPLQTQLP